MATKPVSKAAKARLSKSRYVAGLQCKKMLWWLVHEPVEVDPTTLPQLSFSRGNHVGRVARELFEGGVLIDLPPFEVDARVAATHAAILRNAPFIFEASFVADNVFVSVDVLERRRGGFGIIEVKSTLDLYPHYVEDVAIQFHVLERAGVSVKRADIMFLNRDYRHPDKNALFLRADMTTEVREAAATIPATLKSMSTVLRGKLPNIEIGDHCNAPYKCGYMNRCWPEEPEHHIRSLFGIRSKKRQALMDSGVERIHDIPVDFVVTGVARRQIDSVRSGKTIVDPGLSEGLARIKMPVAYLDFETVGPAIPEWDGCGPYTKVPVQLSCHLAAERGLEHRSWLANGAGDPRKDFALALIDACEGSKTILAYHASFEKGCISTLIELFPKLAPKLKRITDRTEDLLPLVRNHVYHPEFNGSFSIKRVLPALVPGLGYDDLEIGDGMTASLALEALLLDSEMESGERTKLRGQLLAYCERDTLAMVRLHERLKALAIDQVG